MTTPIFHSILLKEDTWARAYVNELPLYKSVFVGPDSRSGPINDLLVPGENEITIELLRTKKLHNSPHLKHAFTLEIYEVLNPDVPNPETTPVERNIIHAMKFPTIMDALDERHRRYPMYFRSKFDPGIDLAEPPFAKAPKMDFDCEGTPELRDAVKRIHDAIEFNDIDGFFGELALKFEHAERSLAGVDEMTAKAKKEGFRDGLFAYGLTPRPLDLNELHFEPLLEGRVAHVTRLDGGFALEAICTKDTKRRMRTDLLMTHHQGRWRVFA